MEKGKGLEGKTALTKQEKLCWCVIPKQGPACSWEEGQQADECCGHSQMPAQCSCARPVLDVYESRTLSQLHPCLCRDTAAHREDTSTLLQPLATLAPKPHFLK